MLSGDAQIVLTGVATLSLATSIGLAVNGVRTPRVIRDAFDAVAETLLTIAPPPDDPELLAILDQIDAPAKDEPK